MFRKKKNIEKQELEVQRKQELENLRRKEIKHLEKEMDVIKKGIHFTSSAVNVNQKTLMQILDRIEKLEEKKIEEEINKMFG